MFATESYLRPVGIFDSGLGGLTVAAALMKLLPNEDIVYFGDTGRVPYGNRSELVIRKYARQDVEFLLSIGVKMIVAACGTVSSVAPDIGTALPIPFVEVVSPAARAAVKATKNGRIGVAGTSATVRSGSFVNSIKKLNADFSVFQQNCPLFVNIVEEGFTDLSDPLPELIARRYLEPLKKEGVDTLILGCTHFPLLSSVIAKVMGENVTLINTGETAAAQVKAVLSEKGLLRPTDTPGKTEIFESDRVEGFSRIAGAFLGHEISGDVTQIDWGEYS